MTIYVRLIVHLKEQRRNKMIKLKIWQIIIGICYLITTPRLYYILSNLNEKNPPFTDYIIVMMWIILVLIVFVFSNTLKKINDFLNKEIEI